MVQAGHVLEALQECEVLQKEGVAFSLTYSLICKMAFFFLPFYI